MKGKSTAKAGGRRSSRQVSLIAMFIAGMVLIVLISLTLLPIVALAVILPKILLSIGASFLESFNVFMASLTRVIELAAYAVFLVLIGDNARLFTLIPELLDWLRLVWLL
jgi:hypothetical protein